jgi:hypothetical protein
MSSKARSAELSLREQRGRLGDLEQYAEPRRTDRAEWDVQTKGAIDGTQALIDSLGENDPILRAMLQDTLAEIQAAGQSGGTGRRLLERSSYEIKMTDALVNDELVNSFGRDGIPGVTFGSCEVIPARSNHNTRHSYVTHNGVGFLHRPSVRRCARTPTAPTTANAVRLHTHSNPAH